jgi:hypothetical protein
MWNYMLLFHIGRPSLPVSGTVMETVVVVN